MKNKSITITRITTKMMIAIHCLRSRRITKSSVKNCIKIKNSNLKGLPLDILITLATFFMVESSLESVFSSSVPNSSNILKNEIIFMEKNRDFSRKLLKSVLSVC